MHAAPEGYSPNLTSLRWNILHSTHLESFELPHPIYSCYVPIFLHLTLRYTDFSLFCLYQFSNISEPEKLNKKCSDPRPPTHRPPSFKWPIYHTYLNRSKRKIVITFSLCDILCDGFCLCKLQYFPSVCILVIHYNSTKLGLIWTLIWDEFRKLRVRYVLSFHHNRH